MQLPRNFEKNKTDKNFWPSGSACRLCPGASVVSANCSVSAGPALLAGMFSVNPTTFSRG